MLVAWLFLTQNNSTSQKQILVILDSYSEHCQQIVNNIQIFQQNT
jgi:hypothetical protein